MNAWLDYRDGQWLLRPLTEAGANEARAKGYTVVEMRDTVWAAWEAHLAQASVFDALWTTLNNANGAEREAARAQEQDE